MEESLSLLNKIKTEFACPSADIRTCSPLTLAFVGDCVFDLIIRTVIVERANRSPGKLHQIKSQTVKAATQARLGEAIAELLTETEADVYRRGRNAKSATTAKNATVADYRKATALEALVGYLYLTGQEDRMLDLISQGLKLIGIEL
jgi:ribonuclease-3 family protein